jgi:uncharacterized protein
LSLNLKDTLADFYLSIYLITEDLDMELNNFSSGYAFYDDANFPYGFARSGDFTIQEAENLTKYGYMMNQLANKKISPENEEQEHFVQVVEGKTQPLYNNEQLYLKYKKLTEKKDVFLNPFVTIDKQDEDEAALEEMSDDLSYDNV